MTHTERQAQACARLFVKARDAAKIAKALDVTERTVYNLVTLDAFHTELDALGYTGERNFRKRRRGKSLKHDKALSLWEGMQTDGTPKHKQAGIISKKVNAPIQTVRGWIRGWREETPRLDVDESQEVSQ